MNISGLINIAEPHLQRFNFYTPLQQRALDILKLAVFQSADDTYVREFLQYNQVNDPEISWLESSGYFLPAST